jgi:aryl-alcohol dehydrogenase-like predicted oxidoreductase
LQLIGVNICRLGKGSTGSEVSLVGQQAIEQVHLGATDLQVSGLGIGTWAWGDRLVWGYGGGGYTDDDLKAAFQVTVDVGINFFDTAEMYGFPTHQSEKLLGKFKEQFSNIVIATKFFPLPWRFTKGQLIAALKGSVRRLGIRQVDLYQIHWPTPFVPLERWMDALADAVEMGLTKTVGVSNYNTEEMHRAYAALANRGVPLASNQVEYSLLNRDPERTGLLAACKELNITLIAYSPLAMGRLTGKYTAENPLKGVRGRMYSPEHLSRIQPLIAKMREIGVAHGGKSPAQVALNWTMCKGTIPIPGAKNVRQAQENASALGWRLTDSEVAVLDEMTQAY